MEHTYESRFCRATYNKYLLCRLKSGLIIPNKKKWAYCSITNRNVSITTVVHFPDYSPDRVNLVVTETANYELFKGQVQKWFRRHKKIIKWPWSLSQTTDWGRRYAPRVTILRLFLALTTSTACTLLTYFLGTVIKCGLFGENDQRFSRGENLHKLRL